MKKAIRKRDRNATERELNIALETLLVRDPLKVSIAAVARDAGVTPALIHNKYPALAEQIRTATGKAMRSQRDESLRRLMNERERNRALRAERDALLQDVRDLASENEALRREFVIQQAIAAGSVAQFPVRPTR